MTWFHVFKDPSMKLALKILGVLAFVLVLAAGGAYAWASRASDKALSRTFTVHQVDFPIPFPLTEDEIVEAGLTPEEASDSALERALERGRHLIEARYACNECHGADFSGGVMVDDPMIGTLLGPNLTLGEGSRTTEYGPADWDRIVRHGVRPDGTPATMPSEDFQRMSDEELSDIVAYIRSQPPVDNAIPPVSLGPLGKILVATGQLPLSADRIPSHEAPHTLFPPTAEVSAEFGAHLAGICSGCHGEDLSGGPIAGGDPSWVPARNLTPHEDGLAGWTYEQFVRAMREGVRPDGTPLQAPMTLVASYAQNMTDVELQALWAYLQSVPAVPSTFE
jgi:mono/diheme cytochrome c family protein